MATLGPLHHVTAITGDAPANLQFYCGVLGMRLVKKSVNQDDVSAYHLFYADAVGSPGTDLTFFDWPRAAINRAGVPDLAPVGLRVNGQAAIEWWRSRLEAIPGVEVDAPAERFGRLRLAFRDPEGQRLELVDDAGADGGIPWDASPVPAAHQIRGLDGIGMVSADPQASADFFVAVLGFAPSGEEPAGAAREYLFAAGVGGPGAEIRLRLPGQSARWAEQGRGGVHHVAFRVADRAEQDQWRERVVAAGLRPSPVIDRFYFQSVYFREPGGNLFEIATDGPGFTADEPEAELGKHLALPPFLEPRRQEIEAGLQPLPA